MENIRSGNAFTQKCSNMENSSIINEKNCACSSSKYSISNSASQTYESSEKNIQIPESERQVCEVWSRVMGYYRPIDSYNVGKKSEYDDRRCFNEPSKVKMDSESTVCRDCISQAA